MFNAIFMPEHSGRFSILIVAGCCATNLAIANSLGQSVSTYVMHWVYLQMYLAVAVLFHNQCVGGHFYPQTEHFIQISGGKKVRVSLAFYSQEYPVGQLFREYFQMGVLVKSIGYLVFLLALYVGINQMVGNTGVDGSAALVACLLVCGFCPALLWLPLLVSLCVLLIQFPWDVFQTWAGFGVMSYVIGQLMALGVCMALSGRIYPQGLPWQLAVTRYLRAYGVFLMLAATMFLVMPKKVALDFEFFSETVREQASSESDFSASPSGISSDQFPDSFSDPLKLNVNTDNSATRLPNQSMLSGSRSDQSAIGTQAAIDFEFFSETVREQASSESEFFIGSGTDQMTTGTAQGERGGKGRDLSGFGRQPQGASDFSASPSGISSDQFPDSFSDPLKLNVNTDNSATRLPNQSMLSGSRSEQSAIGTQAAIATQRAESDIERVVADVVDKETQAWFRPVHKQWLWLLLILLLAVMVFALCKWFWRRHTKKTPKNQPREVSKADQQRLNDLLSEEINRYLNKNDHSDDERLHFVIRAYHHFLDVMASMKIVKADHQTPNEFAVIMAGQFGYSATETCIIANLFSLTCYGEKSPSEHETQEFIQAIEHHVV